MSDRLLQFSRTPLTLTVRNILAKLASAAPRIFVRGIDVSAYQKISDMNYPLLAEQGVGFVIVKGDQATATANHMALAREGKIPVVGEYFWDDPTQTAQAQIECFAADIRLNRPDCVFLDVEQYWAYWQDYWDYLSGKIKQAAIRRKSPQAIADHAQAVLVGLRKLFPDLYIGLYTGTWFVLGYAQPMTVWMPAWPIWMAHYYTSAITTVTWEQLAALPPQPFTVWMPSSSLTWAWWQFASTIICPAGGRWDWSAFPGTLHDLLVEIGLGPGTPTTDERLTALESDMRIVKDNLGLA